MLLNIQIVSPKYISMDSQVEDKGISAEAAVSPTKLTFFGALRRYPRTSAVLFGILVVCALWGWQVLSYRRDIRIVQEHSAQAIYNLRHEMLLLLAKPMVWGLRSEIMRGNMEQVQFLLEDIVTEGNFIFIHVIDPQGVVIASTDLGMKGNPVGTDISEHSLTSEIPLCELDGDTRMLVSSPIMGTDRRIATLVFAYRCCAD